MNAGEVPLILQAIEQFTPASDEKKAALSHFKPGSSLISRGEDRATRRQLNEKVLETGSPAHSHADRFRNIIAEEVDGLIARAAKQEELDWLVFFEGWLCIVRRVVFGNAARDDHALTDMIEDLRSRANWAFAIPINRAKRTRFHEALDANLKTAAPGSLGSLVMAQNPSFQDAPTHQIAQWLFAFDPAGMTTFRSLALLASAPQIHDRCLQEAQTINADHPLLRACFLETLRLFPTTPAILRQTTSDVALRSGHLAKGSGAVIYAPFFHRARWTSSADQFDPDFWIGRDPEEAMPAAPFSGGPGVCPAKNLVPLLGAETLAALLRNGRIQILQPTWLGNAGKLRGTLNHFDMRFKLEP